MVEAEFLEESFGGSLQAQEQEWEIKLMQFIINLGDTC